jgi:hypothetical protein
MGLAPCGRVNIVSKAAHFLLHSHHIISDLLGVFT